MSPPAVSGMKILVIPNETRVLLESIEKMRASIIRSKTSVEYSDRFARHPVGFALGNCHAWADSQSGEGHSGTLVVIAVVLIVDIMLVLITS